MNYFSPSKEEKPRFHSVRVRPFKEYNSAESTTRSVVETGKKDSVFMEWVTKKNLTEPLILILDFAPDVRETLLAISNNLESQDGSILSFQNSQWIYGELLINLDNNEVSQTIECAGQKGWILHGIFQDIQAERKTLDRAMSKLNTLEPTTFLIDFSQVRLEKVFPDRSRQIICNFSSLSYALSDFCNWVASYKKHRVIIGLPRFLLAQPDFGDLVQNISPSWSFITAELFSHEHGWRADYCEGLLKDIPLPEILRA